MTRQGSFVDQDVWVEWYDGYDKAVIYWLLNNIKRDGKAVPCVFAAPERAFGQLAKVLSKKTKQAYTAETVPLPFTSLFRLEDRADLERRWHKGRIAKLAAIDAAGARMPVELGQLPVGTDLDHFNAWEGMEFPTPVVIPYHLDVWARNLRDLDLIYKAVVVAMDQGDLTYLDVKHPAPMNTWMRPMRWSGISNNSDLEVPDDGHERTLKYTLTFEVDAYILKPTSVVKAVKAAQLAVHEMDTDTLIEAWELYDVRV